MRTTKGFREFFQGKFNFPGKRVTGKTGSRVRISLSPQDERVQSEQGESFEFESRSLRFQVAINLQRTIPFFCYFGL